MAVTDNLFKASDAGSHIEISRFFIGPGSVFSGIDSFDTGYVIMAEPNFFKRVRVLSAAP